MFAAVDTTLRTLELSRAQVQAVSMQGSAVLGHVCCWQWKQSCPLRVERCLTCPLVLHVQSLFELHVPNRPNTVLETGHSGLQLPEALLR